MLFPTRLVASCAAVALTVGVAAPAMAAIPAAPAAKAGPAASTAPLTLTHDAPTGKSQEVFHLSTTPGASRAGEIAYVVLDAGKKGGNVILESALVNAAGKVSFDVPLGVKGKHSLTIITQDAAGGTDFASQSRTVTVAPDGVSEAEDQLMDNATENLEHPFMRTGRWKVDSSGGTEIVDPPVWETMEHELIFDDPEPVVDPGPNPVAEDAAADPWAWNYDPTTYVKSAVALAVAIAKGLDKGDVGTALENYALSLIGISFEPNPDVTEIDAVEKRLSAQMAQLQSDLNKRFDGVITAINDTKAQITALQDNMNQLQDQSNVAACQNQLLTANKLVSTIRGKYQAYRLVSSEDWSHANLSSTDTLAQSSAKAGEGIFGSSGSSKPTFANGVADFQSGSVTPLAELLVPGGSPGSAGLIPTCASAIASLANEQSGMVTKGGDPVLGAVDDFYFTNLQAITNYYTGWVALGQRLATQGELATVTYFKNPTSITETANLCQGATPNPAAALSTCSGLLAESAHVNDMLTKAANITGASWTQMTSGRVSAPSTLTGSSIKAARSAWFIDIADYNHSSKPLDSTYRPPAGAPSSGVSALKTEIYKGLAFQPADTTDWNSLVMNPSRPAYPGATLPADVICTAGGADSSAPQGRSCYDPYAVYQRMDASGLRNAGGPTKNLILYTGEQYKWTPVLATDFNESIYGGPNNIVRRSITMQPVTTAMFLDTTRHMNNGMSVVIGAKGSPIDASSVFSTYVTLKADEGKYLRQSLGYNWFMLGMSHLVSNKGATGTPGQGIPQPANYSEDTPNWWALIADPHKASLSTVADLAVPRPAGSSASDAVQIRNWSDRMAVYTACGTQVPRRAGQSWLWAQYSQRPAGELGGASLVGCDGYVHSPGNSISDFVKYDLTHSASMYLSGAGLNFANLQQGSVDTQAVNGIDPGTITPDFLAIPAWSSAETNIPNKPIKPQYMWPVVRPSSTGTCAPTSFTRGPLNTIDVMQACQSVFTAYTAAHGTVNGPVQVARQAGPIPIGKSDPREFVFTLINTSNTDQTITLGLSGLGSQVLPQGGLSSIGNDGTRSVRCTLVPKSTTATDECTLTVAPGATVFSQQLASPSGFPDGDLSVGVIVSNDARWFVDGRVYSSATFDLDPHADHQTVDVLPATPTITSAVAGDFHRVKLAWAVPAAAGKIDSYKILGTGPNGERVSQNSGSGTAQLTVPVSGKWSFTVTAVQADPVLESLPSEPATVTVGGEDFTNAVARMAVKVPSASNSYVGYINWQPTDNKAPGLSFTIRGSSDKGGTMPDVTIPGNANSSAYAWNFPKKALSAGKWTFTITGTSDHGDLIPASQTVTVAN